MSHKSVRRERLGAIAITALFLALGAYPQLAIAEEPSEAEANASTEESREESTDSADESSAEEADAEGAVLESDADEAEVEEAVLESDAGEAEVEEVALESDADADTANPDAAISFGGQGAEVLSTVVGGDLSLTREAPGEGFTIGGEAATVVAGVELDVAGGLNLRPGVGVRVGGYGFREVAGDEAGTWADGRMDGLGVFGTLGFGPGFFGEVALDLYTALGSAVEGSGMDRSSVSLLAAIGYRAFPESIFGPIIQVGVGAEYSEVDWTRTNQSITGIYPLGFLGTGAEVEIGDQFRMGANLRLYMMAAFAPQPSEAAGTHEELEHQHLAVPPDPSAAGQIQLWARFDI